MFRDKLPRGHRNVYAVETEPYLGFLTKACISPVGGCRVAPLPLPCKPLCSLLPLVLLRRRRRLAPVADELVHADPEAAGQLGGDADPRLAPIVFPVAERADRYAGG